MSDAPGRGSADEMDIRRLSDHSKRIAEELFRVVGVLAVVALAGWVVSGCGGGRATDALPSWVPDELAGLTIQPGGAGEPSLTQQDATAIVRDKLLFGGGPSEEPAAHVVRVTGNVIGEGETPIEPSGEAEIQRVEDKLAWLLAWRGVEESSVMQGAPDAGSEIDFVAIVDAQTGEILMRLFLYGENRLE